MAESKPWPEKLCGMPNIPKRKTSRIPTMSANFQRRFLFMTRTESNYQGMSRLRFCFFLRRCNRGHGGLSHLHSQIVRRNSQMNGIIFQGNDGSSQAPAGDHFVSGLQGVKHGRPLLLPALLRKNQQKIKDCKDKNKRGDTEPSHSATTSLHCQQKLHVH